MVRRLRAGAATGCRGSHHHLPTPGEGAVAAHFAAATLAALGQAHPRCDLRQPHHASRLRPEGRVRLPFAARKSGGRQGDLPPRPPEARYARLRAADAPVGATPARQPVAAWRRRCRPGTARRPARKRGGGRSNARGRSGRRGRGGCRRRRTEWVGHRPIAEGWRASQDGHRAENGLAPE